MLAHKHACRQQKSTSRAYQHATIYKPLADFSVTLLIWQSMLGLRALAWQSLLVLQAFISRLLLVLQALMIVTSDSASTYLTVTADSANISYGQCWFCNRLSDGHCWFGKRLSDSHCWFCKRLSDGHCWLGKRLSDSHCWVCKHSKSASTLKPHLQTVPVRVPLYKCRLSAHKAVHAQGLAGREYGRHLPTHAMAAWACLINTDTPRCQTADAQIYPSTTSTSDVTSRKPEQAWALQATALLSDSLTGLLSWRGAGSSVWSVPVFKAWLHNTDSLGRWLSSYQHSWPGCTTRTAWVADWVHRSRGLKHTYLFGENAVWFKSPRGLYPEPLRSDNISTPMPFRHIHAVALQGCQFPPLILDQPTKTCLIVQRDASIFYWRLIACPRWLFQKVGSTMITSCGTHERMSDFIK